MADVLNITDTSWSGPALDYMITRAVVDVDTIVKGCANVVDGIRKQITIPRVEVSGLIQHYAATPVSTGNTTVDGRVLDPQKFEMYQEFNPADFEQHFFAEQFEQDRLVDRTLPPTAENFIMLQYMKRLNEYFERAFWNSRIMFDPAGLNVNPMSKGYTDTTLQTNADYMFDGFLYKALQDGTVQMPVSWVAPTYSNIRESIMLPLKQNIMNNPISQALAYKYGPLGLRYFMSYTDQDTYEEALINDQFKSIDSTQSGINRYKGHDIVPLAGMNPGTIFLTVGRPDIQSNLWIGVNSTDDVQLEMKRTSNPSDLWYVKGIFKVDVNHGWGDQMALFTNITK
jgi:hypothetical protein